MHSYQRGHAHAFGEQFAHTVAGRFRRDHGDVDIRGRLDLTEVDVEAVGEHEGLARREVRREMVLVRVRTVQETRTAVLKEAEIFAARVVDSSTEGFALEATGDPEKLDEFIDVMQSYGEIETTRSGVVAVSLEAKKLRLQPPVLTEAR